MCWGSCTHGIYCCTCVVALLPWQEEQADDDDRSASATGHAGDVDDRHASRQARRRCIAGTERAKLAVPWLFLDDLPFKPTAV